MRTLINSVNLIGYLGGDIDVKELSNGSKMAKVNIATNESYKQENGEWASKTTWHSLVAFGYQAEKMEKQLRKGSHVAVKGSLSHNEFEGKDGVKRSYTNIKVSDFARLNKEELPF